MVSFAKNYGESLVFLISQPRSGSTLLQRILAGHPRVLSSAEPWLMLHPLYALRKGDLGLQAEYNARLANRALEDFLVNYTDGERTYLEAVRAWAGVIYGRALDGSNKDVFLDKTPRYYFIIPELRRTFPKAQFIFLIRNPLAVLSSILRNWVRDDFYRLSAYRYDLILAPSLILEGLNLIGGEAIVVHYESLVKYPEEVVSCICQGLDLSYSDDMLHYGSNPVPKGSMGDAVGIPSFESPSPDNLHKWKALVETEQTRHFAAAYLHDLGAELVEHLGYYFSEQKAIVGESTEALSASIVPWNIAIRSPGLWTREERLIVSRAIAIQREGRFRGTLTFVRQNYLSLARALLPE